MVGTLQSGKKVAGSSRKVTVVAAAAATAAVLVAHASLNTSKDARINFLASLQQNVQHGR